jgi:hypothetical protein
MTLGRPTEILKRKFDSKRTAEKTSKCMQGMVRPCNLSTWESEASLSCTVRPLSQKT